MRDLREWSGMFRRGTPEGPRRIYRAMSNATLYQRNGITFKVERVPALDPRPRGWELTARGLEPGVTWTHLSIWKTKREAVTALECFVPRCEVLCSIAQP